MDQKTSGSQSDSEGTQFEASNAKERRPLYPRTIFVECSIFFLQIKWMFSCFCCKHLLDLLQIDVLVFVSFRRRPAILELAEDEPENLAVRELLPRGGVYRQIKTGAGSKLQNKNGPFSAVSGPNFASKHSLESSRRDLHNALLCTVLESNPKKRGKPWGGKDPGPIPGKPTRGSS